MKLTAELTAPYQTHPISENETFAFTSSQNALNGLIERGDSLMVQCKNEIEDNEKVICFNGRTFEILIGRYSHEGDNIMITDVSTTIVNKKDIYGIFKIVGVQKHL